MITIEYQGHTEGALRRIFGDQPVNKAIVRSLNRIAASANTALNKRARETHAIKARDINAAKRITKAKAGSEETVLRYVGARLPLKFFSPTQRKIKVQTKRGPAFRKQVSVKIKKGQRVKITSLPAFLTKRGDVMHRTTQSRVPIKVAMTISVPEMMGTTDQREEFGRVVAERWPVEFAANMDYYLSRL